MVIIGILAIALFEVHLIGGERERQQERERETRNDETFLFRKETTTTASASSSFFLFPPGERNIYAATPTSRRKAGRRAALFLFRISSLVSLFFNKKNEKKRIHLSPSLASSLSFNSILKKLKVDFFSSNGRFLLESAPAAPGAGRARR